MCALTGEVFDLHYAGLDVCVIAIIDTCNPVIEWKEGVNADCSGRQASALTESCALPGFARLIGPHTTTTWGGLLTRERDKGATGAVLPHPTPSRAEGTTEGSHASHP